MKTESSTIYTQFAKLAPSKVGAEENPTSPGEMPFIMVNGQFAQITAIRPMNNGHHRFHTSIGFRDVRNDFSISLYAQLG